MSLAPTGSGKCPAQRCSLFGPRPAQSREQRHATLDPYRRGCSLLMTPAEERRLRGRFFAMEHSSRRAVRVLSNGYLAAKLRSNKTELTRTFVQNCFSGPTCCTTRQLKEAADEASQRAPPLLRHAPANLLRGKPLLRMLSP